MSRALRRAQARIADAALAENRPTHARLNPAVRASR